METEKEGNKMELFSEVFGAYYQMVYQLLRLCGQEGLTREKIVRLAGRTGFGETSVYLLPKLLGEDGWPFLEQLFQEGQPVRWKSRLGRPVKRPVTLLERQWLSAAISDPRAPLFLSRELLGRLEKALEGVAPLYRQGDFRYFDRYLDGDPYDSSAYQKIFRRVLTALEEGRALEIRFQAGPHGGMEVSRTHRGVYIPLQLEFSEKDDKFRVYCKRLNHGRFAGYAVINLGRILEAFPRAEVCEQDKKEELGLLRQWIARQKCAEPAEVEISPERNGIERFLVEFSTFEKESWMEPNGCCRVKIWYPRSDKTEVLIRTLGFGPVVRVLGPPYFLKQVKERVAMQARRLERTGLS